MQLIQLNTWGGRVSGILDFIRQKAPTTNIFCFQEVYDKPDLREIEVPEERPDFFEDLKKILPDFIGFFAPQLPGIGVATFVRKDFIVGSVSSKVVLSEDELRILNSPENTLYYPRIVQTVCLSQPKLAILNFHGVPGDEKKDNEKRKIQTERLMMVLDHIKTPVILTGDFNLNPDTKAIEAAEKRMKNLLKGSDFTTTRSYYYKKKDVMPFSDYIFVSNELDVEDFQVLPDVVSDHLALQVQFKHA